MRFKSFIAKKCKLRFCIKILISLVFIIFLILIYKLRYSNEDSEENHIFSQMLKRVIKREGISYHMFGNGNDIEVVRPLWGKLPGIQIQYYIPESRNIFDKDNVKSNNGKIIYYEGRDMTNFLHNYRIIYKNINQKTKWHVLLYTNIVVNKTVILAELNRYKWYYPILITFSRGSTEDKFQFDFSKIVVSIVSSTMLEKLQKMKNFDFVKELDNQWIMHQIPDKVPNFFCPHNNEEECYIQSQLQTSMVCLLPGFQLLSYAISLLLINEKIHIHHQLAEEAREYSTALNLIPHKYMHEVRQLYDREEEWGWSAMSRWELLEFPLECRELQHNCFISSLLKNSMPIPLIVGNNTGEFEWKILRAYRKFSLHSWEEYLLLMENSGGNRYLYRIVNTIESLSNKVLITEKKRGGLLLVQEGENDPMDKLDQYHDLLRQQEKYLTSTRYPMLFSIHLVLITNSLYMETLHLKLDALKQDFPELDVQFWDKNRDQDFLLDIVSVLNSNNVVLSNNLNKIPHYNIIEKCYSHTRLDVQIFPIPGSNECICVTAEEYVRALKGHPDNVKSLSDINTLFNHLKTVRFLQ